MSFEKEAPLSSICILQTTELPFCFRGKKSFDLVKKLCEETLPKIAISCDADLSVYIPNITSRFYLLDITKTDYYLDLYYKGIEEQRKILKDQLRKKSHLMAMTINNF